MKRTAIYCLVTSFILSACGSSSVPSSSPDAEKYKEDLSTLRPKYDKPPENSGQTDVGPQKDYSSIHPSHDVNESLNAVLDSIDIIRKDTRYIDGFTILVYSGTNSEEARLARGKVFSILPDSNPILKFDEPNFKVKIGEFFSRLEAQKSFAQLRKKFPGALIIPERIPIR